MSSGYSGTPLQKKLGIKPHYHLFIFHPPSDYAATLGAIPEDCRVYSDLSEPLDFIQGFFTEAAGLHQHLANFKAALKSNGMFWICWPKKAAKIPSDLNRDIIREIGLAAGLIDVKTCAIEERWSGLKFVYRLKDRK